MGNQQTKQTSIMAVRRRSRKRRTTRRRRTTKRRTTRRKRTTRKRRTVRRRARRRVTIRGSRSQVWRGTKQKTKSSGMTKSQLMKNKRGKIVSKKSTCSRIKKMEKKWIIQMGSCFQTSKKKIWESKDLNQLRKELHFTERLKEFITLKF